MKTNVFVLFLMCFASFLANAQKEQLFWSDEFYGAGSPDPAKWNYDLGNNGWGNNEIQNYTNSTNNVRIENGLLIIEAHKLGTTWTSARIKTQNLFNLTYGRIVFRAKLPTGSGTWPALWMLGQNFATQGWPACGEIDVMEHVGKDPGKIHSSLHTTSSSGNTINTGQTIVGSFGSQFHDYQANWTPDKIEFSVDGIIFYTYNPPVKNAATWPFDHPFFFIMNIAMGGNWGSDPQYETGGLKNGIDPALSLARMEIDYVRVYKPSASTGDLLPGESNIQVSPNPSTGQVYLNSPEGHTIKGMISNLLGKEVYQFQSADHDLALDLSFLPKGLYFFNFNTGQNLTSCKVILE